MWKDFNTSWLVALQKQKSLMEDMINTGQRPQPPQSLIDGGTLQKMGDNLTENCNKLEKHGLVDYEMGVWEEEIIASECIRLRSLLDSI